MNDKYVVEGYSFKTETEAMEARNELEGIEYLKKRTNFKSPKDVLAVYNKVIEKKLFKTPVGYNFLREMQQSLYNSEDIAQELIQSIPVIQTAGREKKIKEKHISLIPGENEKKYKGRMTNMIILNILLIIAIIVIIIITNNSDNTNILNYKERLDREYQQKEDDLAVWDQELKLRELELNGSGR